MSSAAQSWLLFILLFYITLPSHFVDAFYTASSITTTEASPEYEFLKIQTTTTAPVALLNSDNQQTTTTQSPSRLNSLLSMCEDDDSSSEDKDDRSRGEEAAEEDKRILHYVSALKDTETVQPLTSNLSTAENRRVVQQQKLTPSEEAETEEVFPMTMIKSFKVAEHFGEINKHQIEQPGSASKYLTGSSTTPLKLPVFTRYSLEARPFSAFSPPQQGDNYDQRSSYEEPLLNEIINEIEPQIIEVLPGNFRPLEIHFKSSSRRIKLVQKPPEKDSQQRELEVTRSEEEPQRLIHTVVKPIIQEVREFIYPKRLHVQEIHPVQETFHTIVSTRTNKFNAASNDRSPPVVKSESLRALEPVLSTSSPAPSQLLPIVESLADVENQILEQSSSKEEPVLASQTSIRPLTVSAPRQLRSKPLFTTDHLLSSYLKPNNKDNGEEDDLVYQHLRSRKYRRNVTLKKRKSTGGQQQQRRNL